MTAPIEDGGPTTAQPQELNNPTIAATCEIALRDYFAGQALACVAHEYIGGTTPKAALAEDCYELADAMLDQRKRGGAA